MVGQLSPSFARKHGTAHRLHDVSVRPSGICCYLSPRIARPGMPVKRHNSHGPALWRPIIAHLECGDQPLLPSSPLHQLVLQGGTHNRHSMRCKDPPGKLPHDTWTTTIVACLAWQGTCGLGNAIGGISDRPPACSWTLFWRPRGVAPADGGAIKLSRHGKRWGLQGSRCEFVQPARKHWSSTTRRPWLWLSGK
jgi:hypothetical protein